MAEISMPGMVCRPEAFVLLVCLLRKHKYNCSRSRSIDLFAVSIKMVVEEMFSKRFVRFIHSSKKNSEFARDFRIKEEVVGL